MQAREAFAQLEALSEVRDTTTIPGLRALTMRARADVDWKLVAATVRISGYTMFGRYELDDLAANFRRVQQLEAGREPIVAEDRRAAWQNLADRDPRLAPGRMVAHAFSALEQRRHLVWDPRLEEVRALVDAWRECWAEILPGPLDAVESAANEALVERVRTATILKPVLEAQLLVHPRQTLATVAQPLVVSQCLAAAKIERTCLIVSVHADRVAGRTDEPARAARYRELASQCRQLAAAARVAKSYSAN